ncbi:MAG: hypothetical protein BRD55_05105 [Bacteroidetes bacterium SW_9_63_38]|nr:MAG: hypothetical protein BRD55_05105 [Bacteroidetes bacterium SW_9_63_38]
MRNGGASSRYVYARQDAEAADTWTHVCAVSMPPQHPRLHAYFQIDRVFVEEGQNTKQRRRPLVTIGRVI